jgi:hypothetical protein
MDKARLIFAGVVTAAFIVAAVFLVVSADTKSADEWARLVYVFGAFEAIAFTAVGWVFGAEVHRQRADEAKERAKESDQRKDAELEKGRTLAGMVVGRGSTDDGGRARLEPHGPGGGGAPDPAVEYARSAYNITV